MNDNTYTQDQQPLSLSNSPSHQPEPKPNFPKLHDRRSSSEPAEFFEFFSDLTFQMSHAEDIIYRGKLIPLNQKSYNLSSNPDLNKFTAKNDHKTHKKRSESISEMITTRCDSNKTRVIRKTHSLNDYKKLSRNSSMSSESSDKKYASRSGFKVRKPRWYLMMFGFVKFPPEMDLRDIKNRQVRRKFDSEKRVPVSRSEGSRRSWGLLRVLSCKDHASVAVAASFGCLQRV
ncbi:hypothetical protein LguiA_010973 [Lonicera macranthoides]